MISHLAADQDYVREFDEVVDALATGPTVSYGWIKRALRSATLSQLGDTQAIEEEGQRGCRSAPVFRRAADRFRGRIDHNGKQS